MTTRYATREIHVLSPSGFHVDSLLITCHESDIPKHVAEYGYNLNVYTIRIFCEC